MIAVLVSFVHSRYAVGAVAGLLTAFYIDFRAFLTWKSWHEAVTFSWSTASLRWVQGALGGALIGTLFPAQ